MTIDFENISDYVIPLDDFKLNWRFNNEDNNVIPDNILVKLKPLDNSAAQFLHDYLIKMDLHSDFPFKNGFFKQIDTFDIIDNNKQEVRNWLINIGLDYNKDFYLSWNPDNAMIVPLRLIIDYYDDFYYAGSDDLTIFQKDLHVVILFSHDNRIFFGTK